MEVILNVFDQKLYPNVTLTCQKCDSLLKVEKSDVISYSSYYIIECPCCGAVNRFEEHPLLKEEWKK